jgi:hypothetical protein
MATGIEFGESEIARLMEYKGLTREELVDQLTWISARLGPVIAMFPLEAKECKDMSGFKAASVSRLQGPWLMNEHLLYTRLACSVVLGATAVSYKLTNPRSGLDIALVTNQRDDADVEDGAIYGQIAGMVGRLSYLDDIKGLTIFDGSFVELRALVARPESAWDAAMLVRVAQIFALQRKRAYDPEPREDQIQRVVASGVLDPQAVPILLRAVKVWIDRIVRTATLDVLLSFAEVAQWPETEAVANERKANVIGCGHWSDEVAAEAAANPSILDNYRREADRVPFRRRWGS